MSSYNLKSLVKQKTCFKNPDNPSCIDLILTNSPRSFQVSSVFETGLFDFYKLTTSLKTVFPEATTENSKLQGLRKFPK